MQSKKGIIVVLSAPSGTGKGTIIAHLLRTYKDFTFSVSATTRAPRLGEQEGVAYHFITKDMFREMVSRDEFLEYAEYVGEYYGTPKKPVYKDVEDGKNVLLDIEVVGARQVMQRESSALTIFIVPPSIEELERRLRGRGTDSEEKLLARLDKAKAELEEKIHYDNIVINDKAERAAREIAEIVIRKRQEGEVQQ